MAAERHMLSVCFHVLIHKSIVVFLELVPPTLIDLYLVFIQNLFDAIKTYSGGVIGYVKLMGGAVK